MLGYFPEKTPLYSQITSQPISWKIDIKQEKTNQYIIKLTGEVDEDRSEWHIYGLGPYENGPIPTSLTIELDERNSPKTHDTKSPSYKLIGTPYLLTPEHKKYDEMFAMEIGICKDLVIIAQKLEVLSPDSVKLLAIVEWQACDNQSCLPPTEKEFFIGLPGNPKPNNLESHKNHTKKPSSKEEASSKGSNISHQKEDNPSKGTNISHQKEDNPSKVNSNNTEKKQKSIWGVIIEAIIWGIVALLTPCVFPMVPMTVSFFLKQNQTGNSPQGKVLASFFGVSIIALYTLPVAAIIIITYLAGGETVTADIFNWLATHWLPNILFFIIFMIFAASFFGAFEIVLPSWLVNKSDNKSDKGGYAGVFFMALTLVLVSFSCTGPIVGTILIKSTQGEIWEPIITMFAFSTAFALPFTLFAFAPSLLNDLPKSGGWLNSIKVLLGFIEVALGFKFLSVADQVYHWGLLDREIYLAIWIVVFSLMGFYLLGKLRFAHDSPQEHISVKRLALSIVVFTFVVYMIPGMWGAPLKALSGYLPPISSQDFRAAQSSEISAHTNSTQNNKEMLSEINKTNKRSLKSQGIIPTYSDFLHLPHGLEGFFRYEEGLEYARQANKPVFIDFTGHGCVNCREMEARVWSDPRVLNILRDKYVIIALYSDDKKKALESDWILSNNGRVLKTIGKINSYIAMNKFGVNAQPYYAIIDPNTEKHLTEPMGYNLDIEAFLEFLNSPENFTP